ncbi:phosphonopyruvate decarboxylase [Clostridium argentinense CDC 2741]|uniref:Phosphonopyruvate decarboxylase n=1 Tax=Clostridium argentinense CDC 2741 TaxID=1418104 RepID=A0A0C1U6B9_9CLOT|nr:phosphonopyruvate decarboxylase [Clostridium argentinense]ARC85315.1 phosphonopyruvate decarboxylase [Clostridium argentinense]KIE47308.1 phosphonopyruvate decarboxylase [Clostridium argentinense CDC 2741]NFF40938.1 phosphonopyruvate decarboxylase [Clostridium argentinense]NFP51351.1 phosphonopyruvate decarboxylase [Clostridium argentinense]NFP73389.1 phosphonopyruvate decarboxylase [Clostridium argentinense]
MISSDFFYSCLKKNEISFFVGVPDSLLKDFCTYIDKNVIKENHIIAANEGNAVAIASGYYLATERIPVVYMQNSGIGNAINPLISLNDPLVYSIPVLLIIGWRGEPNTKDEPQHVKQGAVTLDLLKAIGVKYRIISDNEKEVADEINFACNYMNRYKEPYALIIRKNTFEVYKDCNKYFNDYELSREDAIDIILSNIDKEHVVISTTGKMSRELFEYRERFNQSHSKDFLTVGSMGHASQIALGIALKKKNKKIYCLDGDGAFIMHMGSIAINGNAKCKNLKHIIINNGCHESVGGQETVGFDIDILSIAKACNYKKVLTTSTKEDLIEKIKEIDNTTELTLLEVKVNRNSRKDLGRPSTTPIENKVNFMNYLKEIE